MRGDLLERSAEQLRDEIGGPPGQGGGRADEAQTLESDEAKDVARLRAERHAHADLLGPLADGIRHHAVEPDGSEEEGEEGENSEEGAEKMRSQYDSRTTWPRSFTL